MEYNGSLEEKLSEAYTSLTSYNKLISYNTDKFKNIMQ